MHEKTSHPAEAGSIAATSADWPSDRYWWTGIAMVITYATLNALAVFLPFIPAPATLVAWGLVLPVAGSIATWVWLARRRRSFEDWWLLGVVLSFLLLLLAFLTFWIRTQIWAAI